ncbi:hypothetical protein GCM10008959_30130 [Deinococcus seoulensis]|uniref:Uncharacterized protein n=1 Tax=Deinococcus seoulensis TaxID=1837379 RepID=A0ABQ2RXK0_9DEIO|nr:hypothetical protein GCM10008959_30130 [Deinococcus seoulensis]
MLSHTDITDTINKAKVNIKINMLINLAITGGTLISLSKKTLIGFVGSGFLPKYKATPKATAKIESIRVTIKLITSFTFHSPSTVRLGDTDLKIR